jgi:hypothetical protein
MIRLSIAAASLALVALTAAPGVAEEYNGGMFGMRQVYGNQYNSYNRYNSYRRPTYNSSYNNSYNNSYESSRRYYGRYGYSYR